MPNLVVGSEPVPGYRLVRRLGDGSCGDVWLAKGPGQTDVALKIFALDSATGWKEFRALSWFKSIRHPHLLPITALWLLDHTGSEFNHASCWDEIPGENSPFPSGTLCIAAMLVGDKTLADVLVEAQSQGSKGIPTTQLLRYLEEIAEALDFLNAPQHRLGQASMAIVHRDVKPENVLLIGGSAVLGDFGLARKIDERAIRSTCMVGTPAFMSPENVDGEGIGTSTDQYSLALTYYVLRTGCLPLPPSDSPEQAARRQWAGKLDLSKVAPDEREAIKRATAFDSGLRFASCSDLVQSLRAAVAGKDDPSSGQAKISDSPLCTIGCRHHFRDSLRELLSPLFAKSQLVMLWDEFFAVFDSTILRLAPSGSPVSADTFACRVWANILRAIPELSDFPASMGTRQRFSELVRAKTLALLPHPARGRQVASTSREHASETRDGGVRDELWDTAFLASVIELLKSKVSLVDYQTLWLRSVECCDGDFVASALGLTRSAFAARHGQLLRRLRVGLALFSGEKSLDNRWDEGRISHAATRLRQLGTTA